MRPLRHDARFDLLGTPVSAVTNREVLDHLVACIEKREQEHVCCCTVNMIMRAREDPELRAAVDSAGLVVPDGMPLVRAGRRRAATPIERFRAADLVLAMAPISAAAGHRWFFYGGAPGVPDTLAESLTARFAGLRVVGAYSPPYRPLSAEEDDAIVERINASGADVVWVGLGCPKQEKWMLAHKGRVKAPIMVGIGAAFDFLSGAKKEVPPLMRTHFEWLWRFGQEPRRLWRRVLVEGPQFVAANAWETVRRNGARRSQQKR